MSARTLQVLIQPNEIQVYLSQNEKSLRSLNSLAGQMYVEMDNTRGRLLQPFNGFFILGDADISQTVDMRVINHLNSTSMDIFQEGEGKRSCDFMPAFKNN